MLMHKELQSIDFLTDCGKPSSPSNGSVRVTSRTIVGRSVQFSCDVGYDLIGSEIVTCEEHGNWSDSPPLCILTGL